MRRRLAFWVIAAAILAARAGAQEFWAPEGLEGRSVTAFGVTPANPRLLYAGSSDGMVFRSENDGGDWVPAAAGLPAAAVRALAVHPDNPLLVYAGTDQGLFRTSDGGSSWIPSGAGITGPTILALAIDPANPAILWVSTNEAGPLHVYRSSNGGDVWEARIIKGPSFGTPSFQFVLSLAVHPQNSTVYAGWHEIVFYNSDGGNVWSKYGDVNHEVSVLLLDPFDPSVTHVGTIGAGTATSVDFAAWAFGAGLGNAAILALVADPTSRGLLYAATGDGRVFRSLDRGASWSETARPSSAPRALVVSPGDGRLRAGTADGILRLASPFDAAPRLPIERASAPRPPILIGPRD